MRKSLLSLVTIMVIGTSTMFGSTSVNKNHKTDNSKSYKTEIVVNRHGNSSFDTYKSCNCKTCKELLKKMEQEKKQSHKHNNKQQPTTNNNMKGGRR